MRPPGPENLEGRYRWGDEWVRVRRAFNLLYCARHLGPCKVRHKESQRVSGLIANRDIWIDASLNLAHAFSVLCHEAMHLAALDEVGVKTYDVLHERINHAHHFIAKAAKKVM